MELLPAPVWGNRSVRQRSCSYGKVLLISLTNAYKMLVESPNYCPSESITVLTLEPHFPLDSNHPNTEHSIS